MQQPGQAQGMVPGMAQMQPQMGGNMMQPTPNQVTPPSLLSLQPLTLLISGLAFYFVGHYFVCFWWLFLFYSMLKLTIDYHLLDQGLVDQIIVSSIIYFYKLKVMPYFYLMLRKSDLHIAVETLFFIT